MRAAHAVPIEKRDLYLQRPRSLWQRRRYSLDVSLNSVAANAKKNSAAKSHADTSAANAAVLPIGCPLKNERDNLANDCQGKENNCRSDEDETTEIYGYGLAFHRKPPPHLSASCIFLLSLTGEFRPRRGIASCKVRARF